MYKALVCCRAGMGSSMLLKIKADQVISENGYPIQTEHGNLDSLNGFSGDTGCSGRTEDSLISGNRWK